MFTLSTCQWKPMGLLGLFLFLRPNSAILQYQIMFPAWTNLGRLEAALCFSPPISRSVFHVLYTQDVYYQTDTGYQNGIYIAITGQYTAILGMLCGHSQLRFIRRKWFVHPNIFYHFYIRLLNIFDKHPVSCMSVNIVAIFHTFTLKMSY